MSTIVVTLLIEPDAVNVAVSKFGSAGELTVDEMLQVAQAGTALREDYRQKLAEALAEASAQKLREAANGVEDEAAGADRGD